MQLLRCVSADVRADERLRSESWDGRTACSGVLRIDLLVVPALRGGQQRGQRQRHPQHRTPLYSLAWLLAVYVYVYVCGSRRSAAG